MGGDGLPSVGFFQYSSAAFEPNMSTASRVNAPRARCDNRPRADVGLVTLPFGNRSDFFPSRLKVASGRTHSSNDLPLAM